MRNAEFARLRARRIRARSGEASPKRVAQHERGTPRRGMRNGGGMRNAEFGTRNSSKEAPDVISNILPFSPRPPRRQPFRIRHSALLNIDRIARVELYAKDSRVAILRDGTRLPVSRAGHARLSKLL